jgi:GT2 family glycosyltransferase
MTIAINILSYNRPHYLKQVLESLAKNDLTDCYVRLWQDGPDTFLQEECLRIYNAISFSGEHICFLKNQGIGNMYRLMKKDTFEENSFEAGIFLEDDLVLGKDYIKILKTLHSQTKDNPHIGMLTAYGPDRFISDLEQKLKFNQLDFGIPSWGFLINRNRYLERKHILEKQYWPLIENTVYKHRNNSLILEKFVKPNGFKINSTSQDTADTIAMLLSKQVKLSTVTRNAKYIGAKGEHFDQVQYEQGYYGKDNIYKYENINNVRFQIPTTEQLLDMCHVARSLGYA